MARVSGDGENKQRWMSVECVNIVFFFGVVSKVESDYR